MTKEVKELNSAVSGLRIENDILKEEYEKCAKKLATWCRRAKDSERLLKIIEKLVVINIEDTDRYSKELNNQHSHQ